MAQYTTPAYAKRASQIEMPDKLEFVLEQGRDWSDPFIVKVDAVPCKNILRLGRITVMRSMAVAYGNRGIAAQRKAPADKLKLRRGIGRPASGVQIYHKAVLYRRIGLKVQKVLMLLLAVPYLFGMNKRRGEHDPGYHGYGS